jgi:hypothetical protein
MERSVVAVDIDVVVADVRHRLHHLERRPKDWGAFFAAARHDRTHAEGVELVRKLAEDHEIVFLTGRPSHLRAATERWLEEHGLGGHRVLMRSGRDRRPAAVIKVETLRRELGDDVLLVVDDDEDVLRAMERAGYATFHADWEARSLAAERTLRRAQERDGRT